MIRVEVIEMFKYKNFDKIEDLKRENYDNLDTYGMLYVGDTFVVTEEMYKYLTVGNSTKKKLVRIIEYVPEKVQDLEGEL